MTDLPCTCLAPGIEHCEKCEGPVMFGSEVMTMVPPAKEILVKVINSEGETLEGEVVDAPTPSQKNLMPSRIGVWCDGCRIVNEADYMVGEHDDQATRFGYARKYLNAQGWQCDGNGDYCPDCKGKAGYEPVTPFTETEILLAQLNGDEPRLMSLVSDLSTSELEELKGHLDALSLTVKTALLVRRAGKQG